MTRLPTRRGRITVASGYWCHDLECLLISILSLGLPDIACAASSERKTPSFEAIESDSDDWQTAQPYSVGDGIGLVSINGGPRISVTGATPSGLNWYLNPAIGGGDPLTSAWNQYSVDGGNSAPNIDDTVICVVPGYTSGGDAIRGRLGRRKPGRPGWNGGTERDPNNRGTRIRSIAPTRAVHGITRRV